MPRSDLLLTNRHFQDLNPLIAGEEICDPGHSFGPAVRKYTLIHYVVRGKGILYSRGSAHTVSAGQAFLILPGEVTTYTADKRDPWHYRWIGFNGSLSHQFSTLPPVFSVSGEPFRQMLEATDMQEYRLAGLLFQLYSGLFSQRTEENQHVRRVKDYIRASYMSPIRVEDIARQLSLDRRYLSRLFKENTGKSIQQYLIDVRLAEAEQHLQQGARVQEAAALSGYPDVSNFTKLFKKHRGKAPAALRKR